MAADTTGLQDRLRDWARLTRDAAGEVVLDLCRADAPVSQATPTNPSPGRLRDSLAVLETYEDGNVFGVAIGSDLDYAQFTDEVDTGPHEIAARNAPMLRFWWDRGPAGPGIYYFFHVNHPGTRGQRWFASRNADRFAQALGRVSVTV